MAPSIPFLIFFVVAGAHSSELFGSGAGIGRGDAGAADVLPDRCPAVPRAEGRRSARG
jgi:hypothetical protein